MPPQTKFGRVYWNQPVGRSGGLSGGQSVSKILSGQLLLQFQSSSLDTWQKCPFGLVDVQDANFVKIPSRITELLPLIWLENACSDNSSYSFCPIYFILGRSVH